MARKTVSTLLKMKKKGIKIATVTAYDASFAKIFDAAGIHAMLIGDSLGMVLQGHDSTVPVTTEQIAYHTRCVRAGTVDALVIADMPFMSYSTKEQAFDTAAELMRAGANMVKLEGDEWLIDTIKGLTQRGVPVCAHLGLTPQSVNVLGGFKIQGRKEDKANAMIEHAIALTEAGAKLMVLECIPSDLAARITAAIKIPTIGIGAGAQTDGQILVMHDLIGISAGYIPKFSKNYLAETGDINAAITKYIEEVQEGVFPNPEQIFN
ncbi:MAG: 3-methyl-2-oxobutanoate hydroxymethyltransferase [Phenylobacterium sp.]|jgi:3-methyl-2-oxobutanoate hydroxymethyltransferase